MISIQYTENDDNSLKKLYIYVHIYVYTNLCITCNLLMALFHKFSRAIKLHTSNEINTEKSFLFCGTHRDVAYGSYFISFLSLGS